jgi:hypothetical protein
MSDTAEAMYRQLSFGCFQSHQSLALDESESIAIKNGRELSRKQISTKIVKSLLGEITIKRFRCCSSKNGSYYPLDAFLNLVSSSFFHELRRRIAIEATKG